MQTRPDKAYLKLNIERVWDEIRTVELGVSQGVREYIKAATQIITSFFFFLECALAKRMEEKS